MLTENRDEKLTMTATQLSRPVTTSDIVQHYVMTIFEQTELYPSRSDGQHDI